MTASERTGGELALDEYLESEVAVAVAATAVVLSPRARRVVRRGAVLGVAGVLKATDVATAAARGIARGATAAAGSNPEGSPDAASAPAVPPPA